MNPLFQKLVGGAIRALLASALNPAFNWLVAHGYLTGGQTQQVVTWLGGVLLVIAWSWIAKHTEQLKFLVAASSPSTVTEAEVEATIKSGAPVPSVTTPKDLVPVPVPNLGKVVG